MLGRSTTSHHAHLVVALVVASRAGGLDCSNPPGAAGIGTEEKRPAVADGDDRGGLLRRRVGRDPAKLDAGRRRERPPVLAVIVARHDRAGVADREERQPPPHEQAAEHRRPVAPLGDVPGPRGGS